MKKQIILLLITSAAISNLDAALLGWRNAARTAFTSGRQTFTSALPKGVITKQTAYFGAKPEMPSNITNVVTKTEPVIQKSFRSFNQQLTNPGYWGRFKNWVNNLFANRSRTALATSTAVLGSGVVIKSWIDEQPVVYAEENISSHRKVPTSLHENTPLTAIVRMPSKEKLQEIFDDLGLEHFTEKTDIIKRLTNHQLNAYGVVMAIALAFEDYKKYMHGTPPIGLALTKMALDTVIKELFEYDPTIIEQLKDKGLIQ